MTRRVAWTAAVALALLAGGGIAFMKASRAHGLIHAAESGNVARVLAELQGAPSDADLWELLGEAYSQRADYESAVSAYQHAIKLNPSDETYWWMLGIAEVCRRSQGGTAAAERGLRNLNPKSADEFRDLIPGGCCAFGGCGSAERRRRTRG